MIKISRVNAFNAMTEAVSNNDMKTANAIYNIVLKSIDNDRKENRITEYIELSAKQKKFFTGKYSDCILENN